MLEIQRIRLNKNQLAEKLLEIRKADFSNELNEAFRIDELKRNTQQKLDDNKSSLNKLSAEIGKLFKEGNHKLANEIKSETGVLKEKIPHVVCGYRLWKWVHPSSNKIFGNLQIFRWKSLPKQTSFPELRRS